ncbi:unnamed protein product [Laminaria digitata]
MNYNANPKPLGGSRSAGPVARLRTVFWCSRWRFCRRTRTAERPAWINQTNKNAGEKMLVAPAFLGAPRNRRRLLFFCLFFCSFFYFIFLYSSSIFIPDLFRTLPLMWLELLFFAAEIDCDLGSVTYPCSARAMGRGTFASPHHIRWYSSRHSSI